MLLWSSLSTFKDESQVSDLLIFWSLHSDAGVLNGPEGKRPTFIYFFLKYTI